MSSSVGSPPVRIGVIGLGRRGMHHLERLGPRAEMIAVAAHDPDPGRARLAQPFATRFHSTAADLLRDPEVEAVLFATSAAVRGELAREAFRCGKHAIVERPLAASVAEADATLAAAREAGLRLAVLQPRRCDEDFRTARDVLRTGRLGELKKARLIVWGVGHAAQAKGPCDEEGAGGVLLDRGADYFDQLLELVRSRPRRVFARLGPPDPATGRERAFTAIVDFDDGAEAHLDVDLDHPAETRAGWTLIGAAGSYRRFQRYTVAADGEVIDEPLEPLPADWDRMYAEIAAHLREGAPLAVPPERSRAVVALIDLCRRSSQLGASIAIPAS